METDETSYEQTPLQRLFNYWHSKQRGERLPARADLDPVEIPDLLSRVVLIDVVRVDGRPRYRFRLVGTDVVAAVGRDLTGQWLDEVGGVGKTDPVIASYDEVVASKRPHAWRNVLHVEGREHVGYWRLICPLAADGETVDMLIGIFVFEPSAPADPFGRK